MVPWFISFVAEYALKGEEQYRDRSNPEGEREVLGLWIAANEGAKFWLSIMNNLKTRGVEDILIAVVDGLKGFPDAINAAFPDTTVQPGLCPFWAELVHWTNSKTPLTLHRAPCAPFSELLRLERSQGGRQKPEADLSGYG